LIREPLRGELVARLQIEDFSFAIAGDWREGADHSGINIRLSDNHSCDANEKSSICSLATSSPRSGSRIKRVEPFGRLSRSRSGNVRENASPSNSGVTDTGGYWPSSEATISHSPSRQIAALIRRHPLPKRRARGSLNHLDRLLEHLRKRE